jgi:hypothetical protein
MTDQQKTMNPVKRGACIAKNAVAVTFNNQNSILLSMYFKMSGVFCLLHDNRIFAFQKNSSSSQPPSTLGDVQNLILNLLTTAKYRAMGFLYTGFHLANNSTFALIIVLSVRNNFFTVPTKGDIALLVVIGAELLYDVLSFTHQYWILQRLQIYVGLVLYVIYFTLLHLIGKTPKVQAKLHVTEPDINTAFWVLCIRFAAFILEILVDIAIDAALHNDLLRLCREEDSLTVENGERLNGAHACDVEKQAVFSHTCTDDDEVDEGKQMISTWSHLKEYMQLGSRNSVEIPPGIKYIGSIFAWGPYSVFNLNVWKSKPFSKIFLFGLCTFPLVIAGLFAIVLLVLFIAAFLLIFVITLCYCVPTCNYKPLRLILRTKIWKELLHF